MSIKSSNVIISCLLFLSIGCSSSKNKNTNHPLPAPTSTPGAVDPETPGIPGTPVVIVPAPIPNPTTPGGTQIGPSPAPGIDLNASSTEEQYANAVKSEFIESCTNANGQWNTLTSTCKCPLSQNAHGNLSRGRFTFTNDFGVCKTEGNFDYSKSLKLCLNEKFEPRFFETLKKDEATFRSCLKALGGLKGLMVTLQSFQEADTPAALEKLAKNLDAQNWKDFVPSFFYMSPFLPKENIYIQSTVILGKIKIDSISDLMDLLSLKYEEIPTGYALKHKLQISLPENFTASLGENFANGLPQPEPPLPLEPFSELNLINRYLSSKVTATQAISISSRIGEKCFKYCVWTERISTDDEKLNQKVDLIRVSELISGIRITSRLEIRWKNESRPAALIVFDLSGRANLLVTVTDTAAPLMPRITAYNENFEKLGEFAQQREIPNQKKITDFADGLSSEFDASSQALILSFEKDFGNLDDSIRQSILTGPYVQLQPGEPGSLLGWFKNSLGNNHNEFSAGFNTFDDVLGLVKIGNPAHGNSVHKLLVGETLADPAIRLAPLGGDVMSAFRSGAVREAAQQLGGKTLIGSVSGAYKLSKASCISRLGGNYSDINLLLVTAAGNDAIEFTDFDSFICPQNFGSQQKKLVVAALKYGALAEYSNYGRQYADIAADGADIVQPGGGTSFAAPRVSHTAAKVVQKFPALGAEKVRMAILLGANVNTASPLPVRSGGTLNAANALRAAEKMQQLNITAPGALSEQQVLDVLKNLHSADEAQKRFGILNENGEFL